ncbi:MAG: hypothetical protein IJP64_05305 [Oscillospiraceae bacterium]|nr:hypothetical protein [Oscillospiraceae bacterium]
MREFLLRICPVALWVIAAIELVIMLAAAKGSDKGKKPLHLLTALVCFGLFYDALIIALGSLLGEGALFMFLSRLRFVFHGALIPLLFAICAYALNFNKTWKTIVWIFTGLLIVLGIAEGFATELSVQRVAEVLRCKSGDGTPAWATAVSSILSYGTVVPLIIAGVVVWIKQKTPALFLAGFLMFAFSALGPATGNFDLIFFISMFGEVCMALFFLIYAKQREN